MFVGMILLGKSFVGRPNNEIWRIACNLQIVVVGVDFESHLVLVVGKANVECVAKQSYINLFWLRDG